MKNYPLKVLLMIFTTATAILSTPRMTSAQVDYSLLTEVVKSCQADVVSPEYYKKIGIQVRSDSGSFMLARAQVEPNYIESCINARYHHLLVLSKLPWLDSSGDVVPGYPGATAVSLMTFDTHGFATMGVLECMISQNPHSHECQNASSLRGVFNISSSNYKIRNLNTAGDNLTRGYIYMCPSCAISIDEISSVEKMTDSFIKWFLTLDKPQRREVMSILGDEKAQVANRENIQEEARRAVQEYNSILQKVEQQRQEQRRIDILGE